MSPLFLFRWRVLRPLLLLLFLTLPAGFYIYHTKFKPPVHLYHTLFDSEVQSSRNTTRTKHGQSNTLRYVKFRQLQGAGFNNQAQEILLYHHLALETSRIYVYQPLIWRPRGEKAAVPLSAFLLGATEGSVSEAVFDEVCPSHEVHHVNLKIDQVEQWFHAKDILNRTDRCVVVDDWIFNWTYLSSPGLREIWPSFRQYLATHFQWSDHVQAIVDRTQAQLSLKSRLSSTDLGEPYMTIHLRRGDFEDHCKFLAESKQGFTTWATLPIFQTTIQSPPLDTQNATSILEHCYPSLHRILDSISDQARNRPHLRRLHVIHDGAWDHPMVYIQFYKLAEALTNAQWAQKQGWEGGPMQRVTHSLDVPILTGERDWSVCVDVELARRAEVFIGNGYSSLSTQVVALRLADAGRLQDITLI